LYNYDIFTIKTSNIAYKGERPRQFAEAGVE
jgi:hypothetical protein